MYILYYNYNNLNIIPNTYIMLYMTRNKILYLKSIITNNINKVLYSTGTLEYGTHGDFLMLDRDTLHVKSTFINGKCVYNNMQISE